MKALEDVMVKYDSTVRNSSEQIIQFLYGEDGMAGEHIEDLKIYLLQQTDEELEDKCNFLPSRATSSEIQELLKQSMEQETINTILNSPSI